MQHFVEKEHNATLCSSTKCLQQKKNSHSSGSWQEKKIMQQFVGKTKQNATLCSSAKRLQQKWTHTPQAICPPLSPSHRHTGAHVDIYDKYILYIIYFIATIDLGLLRSILSEGAFQYLSACLRCWQCLCSLGCCCCHCYCCSWKSIIRYTCIGGHISHNTFLLLLLLLILFATLTTALTADTTKPRNPKEDILFSATHSVSVS